MPGYLARLPFLGSMNSSGSAGPRRLVIIAGCCALGVAAVFGAASLRGGQVNLSNSGRMPSMDPTPGGLHSNVQQDKLHMLANQEQAARAQEAGQSFTPVMPSSQLTNPPRTGIPETPASQAAPPPTTATPTAAATPAKVITPAASVPAGPQVNAQSARPLTVPAPAPQPAAIPVAQGLARTPQDDAAFKAALDRMMGNWGGRPPRTDVILPPDEAVAAEGSGSSQGPVEQRRRLSGAVDAADLPAAAPVSSSAAARQRVLVPAGRGVYAHTVLAANSDQQSPIVLQADSGPLSGDRMIGTFSRERDRLVIRVAKVVHDGQEIGTDGVVVAPGTMEVGVASSVDQNYLSRFLLPAAAAFVQGLGQAIAQSNSTSVLGPLGSVSTQNQLNFNQQLGIGAGVAGAQIGATLQQSAPRGPTVNLDVGSSVGVMFLTNVAADR